MSARIAELTESQRSRMATWAQELAAPLAGDPLFTEYDVGKAKVDVWVDGVQPVRGSVAGVLSGAPHMTVRSAVLAAITEPVHQR